MIFRGLTRKGGNKCWELSRPGTPDREHRHSWWFLPRCVGPQALYSQQQGQGFCLSSCAKVFPHSAIINGNGRGAGPLFDCLKSEKPGHFGGFIHWNFTKFSVIRSGKVAMRFAPQAKPEGNTGTVEA